MEQNIISIWLDINQYLENFVIKKVGNKDAAKDIVQDVFLKVQEKIGTLRDTNKITSWIFQITRNTISDYHRNQKKDVGETFDIFYPDYSEENEPVTDETSRFSQCILPMINALPKKYSEAIKLIEIEGLSQKELAMKLDISYSGAKSRVQRGREKLKELLVQCCNITTDSYGNIIEYHKKPCSDDCN